MSVESSSGTILPGSGERYIRSGNKEKKRWSYNMDLLHPNGNIYTLDTVIYADGSSETVLPRNRSYHN